MQQDIKPTRKRKCKLVTIVIPSKVLSLLASQGCLALCTAESANHIALAVKNQLNINSIINITFIITLCYTYTLKLDNQLIL